MIRLLLIAVLLALAPAAHAQALAERLNQARTAAQVTRALAEDEALRSVRIDASAVQGGAIRLSGRAHTAAQRDRATAVARSVSGVTSVTNEIELVDAPRPAPMPPPLRAATPTPTAPAPTTAPDPPPQPEAQAAEPVHHRVQSGDNLGSIARRYNTSVAELQRLNNISGTNIRIGQQIRVR